MLFFKRTKLEKKMALQSGWLKPEDINLFMEQNFKEGFLSQVLISKLYVDSKGSIHNLSRTLQKMNPLTDFIFSSCRITSKFSLGVSYKYIIHDDDMKYHYIVPNLDGVLKVNIGSVYLLSMNLHDVSVVCSQDLLQNLITQDYCGKNTIRVCNQETGLQITLNKVSFITPKMEKSAAGAQIKFWQGLYSVALTDGNETRAFLCFDKITGAMMFVPKPLPVNVMIFQILEVTKKHPGEKTVTMLADALYELQMCPDLLKLCCDLNSSSPAV